MFSSFLWTATIEIVFLYRRPIMPDSPSTNLSGENWCLGVGGGRFFSIGIGIAVGIGIAIGIGIGIAIAIGI